MKHKIIYFNKTVTSTLHQFKQKRNDNILTMYKRNANNNNNNALTTTQLTKKIITNNFNDRQMVLFQNILIKSSFYKFPRQES